MRGNPPRSCVATKRRARAWQDELPPRIDSSLADKPAQGKFSLSKNYAASKPDWRSYAGFPAETALRLTLYRTRHPRRTQEKTGPQR